MQMKCPLPSRLACGRWTLECARGWACVASESSLLGQAMPEHQPLLCASPRIAMLPARQQGPALVVEDQQVVRSCPWRAAIWSCSRVGASNCYIKCARALYRPGAVWDQPATQRESVQQVAAAVKYLTTRRRDESTTIGSNAGVPPSASLAPLSSKPK